MILRDRVRLIEFPRTKLPPFFFGTCRWRGAVGAAMGPPKVGRRTAKENGLPLGQLKAIPARGKIDGCRSMRPVANPPVFRMFPGVLLASETYAASPGGHKAAYSWEARRM